MAKTKESSSTRFISWNVKGVNNNIKISRIMSHLQHLMCSFFKKPILRQVMFNGLKEHGWVIYITQILVLEQEVLLSLFTEVSLSSWLMFCPILMGVMS